MLGDGGDTEVCLMYVDVGGHEMDNLWDESTDHERFMLMGSNCLENNDLQ